MSRSHDVDLRNISDSFNLIHFLCIKIGFKLQNIFAVDSN